MSTERNLMISSLNKLFVPELRKLNFKGSFPHFRRIENDVTNLITFQFDRDGGGFVIELANHKGKEYVSSWGKITELKKLTAHHLNQRKRIYPNSENEDNGKKSWFRYDEKSFFPFGNIYDKNAKKATERIPLMEKYWRELK
ncbi:DUF4304 domain-containing protein [Flavobacterium sp. GN10]|uniref:DUF4304 domain-containing protein n=1 Tax=Flavobacterium tagetis TaxID=2801336 RepID=A0ABS1KIC5_9FLAO|nr:DUF4304 domain-containing protein [Flavobacterium tagetis]MBL0739185.1 DUF4304 domain-containing protein [Flavobacterium tagetis]